MDSRPQNRAELASFLRTRREALSPDAVGLRVAGRRRTPGLRRDEVAEFASISRTYYERLEQQRGPQPSPTVLAAIARSLRLSAEEREHLYLLAGQAPPPREARPREVDPGLLTTLESLNATTVAFVIDSLGTVLSQNALSAEIFGDLEFGADRAANMVWRWFTDLAWRGSWASEHTYDTTGSALVADLRASVTRRGHDAATSRLIGELSSASGEFADLWDAYDVSQLQPRFELLRHPRAGMLSLECAALQGHAPGQRLILYRAAPGTAADRQLTALTRIPDAATATRAPGPPQSNLST